MRGGRRLSHGVTLLRHTPANIVARRDILQWKIFDLLLSLVGGMPSGTQLHLLKWVIFYQAATTCNACGLEAMQKPFKGDKQEGEGGKCFLVICQKGFCKFTCVKESLKYIFNFASKCTYFVIVTYAHVISVTL